MASRTGRDNCGYLVLFYEYESKVGLHFEHVVFVGDDHAVELLAVLEADFIGLRAWHGERSDTGDDAAKDEPTYTHDCEYAAGPRRGQPLAREELSAAVRSGAGKGTPEGSLRGTSQGLEKVSYRKLAGSIQAYR